MVALSIVIPCYNEGPTFKKNVSRIVAALKKMGLSWEIVFVEDKSRDNTKSTLSEITKKLANSKVIFHPRNEGRGKSVSDGIKKSRGKICGFLDVDCEISPSYIPVFVSEIKKGNVMTIATRYFETNFDGIIRTLASRIYSLLVKKILSVPFLDTEAGFKFFNRPKILPIIAKTRDKKWFWDTEICSRAYFARLTVSQVPVLFVRRSDKESTVKLIRDTFDYLVKIFKFRLEVKKLKTQNGW